MQNLFDKAVKLLNWSKRNRIGFWAAIIGGVLVIGLFTLAIIKLSPSLTNPKGHIANEQWRIFKFAMFLSTLVLIPVMLMLVIFAWKYKDGKKSDYKPDWAHSRKLEAVWWGVPIILIVILAVVTWVTTHSLDPYRPLDSQKKPLRVQVVALQWRWLFIYPEQNIATVNYLQIPEKTPINFEITSDAPMNSFWIPDLGGQIYAMSAMSTKLHLEADGIGVYRGMSSNISGEGFAKMDFKVESVSESDFVNWSGKTFASSSALDYETYLNLARPSDNDGELSFNLADQNLYDKVIDKYMPHHESSNIKKEY